MQDEHEQYFVQKVLSGEPENRTSLSTLLKLDLQKPVKCSGFHILLPQEKDKENVSVSYLSE